MEAYIKSIKLVKTDKGYTWDLQLIGEDGILRKWNNLGISDSENFRKLTFGLLYALNINDFMMFSDNLEIPIKYDGSFTGIKTIANLEGDYISIKEGNLEFGKGIDTSYMKDGKIINISMQSGSILTNIKQNFGKQNFGGLNLLSGLGYPLDGFYSLDVQNNSKRVAEDFKNFIVGMLGVCKIEDLLANCPNERLPKVSLMINNVGNVVSIGSISQEFWINLGEKDVSLASNPAIHLDSKKGQTNGFSFNFTKEIFNSPIGGEDFFPTSRKGRF